MLGLAPDPASRLNRAHTAAWFSCQQKSLPRAMLAARRSVMKVFPDPVAPRKAVEKALLYQAAYEIVGRHETGDELSA